MRLQHSSRLLIGSGPAQQVRQLGNVTDEAQGILMSASLRIDGLKIGCLFMQSQSHPDGRKWGEVPLS